MDLADYAGRPSRTASRGSREATTGLAPGKRSQVELQGGVAPSAQVQRVAAPGATVAAEANAGRSRPTIHQLFGGGPAPRGGAEAGDIQAGVPASSGGAAMEAPLRAQMEHAFQTSFSDVTIHRDSPRAASLGALAYTEGNAVHVAPGHGALRLQPT